MGKSFKKILIVPYESDYVTSGRTARALTKFYDHKDICPWCSKPPDSNGDHIHRCWRGAELWRTAQKAAAPRLLRG